MNTWRSAMTRTNILVILVAAILLVVMTESVRRGNRTNARRTFDQISIVGLEKAEEMFPGDNIQYGYDNLIFKKREVATEKEKYMRNEALRQIEQAICAFTKIRFEGLEEANKNGDIDYGLKQGEFTQERVDAQERVWEMKEEAKALARIKEEEERQKKEN